MMLLPFTFLQAQQKFITKSGTISFYSHAPLEDIKAKNNQVAAVLNTTDGSLTFALLIQSFEFKKALMQEHFNENYMESDDFPKSTFKGTIVDFEPSMTKDTGSKSVKINGELTIHGVTNQINAPATLMVNKGNIIGQAKFIVKPEDYNIKIPKAVRNNIAKEIEVTVNIDLKPH